MVKDRLLAKTGRRLLAKDALPAAHSLQPSGCPPMAKGLALGIDTCTRWMNLALVGDEGRVLGEFHEQAKTHATGLVAAVEKLLHERCAGYKDLAALGVVIGPGSFTGLRVGLAAALGFSRTLGMPVYGIDSLTALAEFAEAKGSGIAILDARRSEVYVRRFQRNGAKLEALGAPEAVHPSRAIPDDFKPAWAIGDGVPLVTSLPSRCALFPNVPNLAIPAAHRALEAHAAGQPGDALSALYVRPPDAKLPYKAGRL